MNKTGYLFAGIGIGAVIGSAITFFITKTVVEKKCDEEINSVVAEFEAKSNETHEEPKAEEPVKADPQHEDIEQITEGEYGSPVNENGPYKTTSIYIYTDGVITLGDNTKIDNPQLYDKVGKDTVKLLALSTNPCCWVRNNKEETDYRLENLDYGYYDGAEDE